MADSRMIVSDRKSFVFIHIPKCAGISVRRVLEPYDDAAGAFSERVADHPKYGQIDYTHMPLDLLAEIEPEVYAKLERYAGFAIARDPFDRFFSSMSQRAKMYRGCEIAQMDAATLRAEVEDAIAYLRDRQRIIAPEFIHFARQIDFVEHAGTRLVDHVFPVERLDAFIAALSAQVGSPLTQPHHENRSQIIRFGGLRDIAVFGSTVAKRMLPERVHAPVRRLARQLLMKPAENNRPDIFQSGTVTDFISDYYAADVALHRAALDRVGQS